MFELIASLVIALLLLVWSQVRRERARVQREGDTYRALLGERVMLFLANLGG